MSAEHPYELIVADERAADAPYTFFVPTWSERERISVGDLVKLGFEYLWDTEEFSGERMWVEVLKKDSSSLTGALKNEPSERGLQFDQIVEFELKNVIAIEWQEPEKHPAFEQKTTYWERCLVDQLVVDGALPVEYVYREEPDLAQPDDKYPDSGWRLRGQQGEATDDDMEAREVAYTALGAVLNRDDSFVHLLKQPIGSAFMRNFETGQYDREE
ncbi:DUF2185 domain-containing protein [Sphingorhabdus sp.]|uniref:immunity protein Imm33 domain-containing protein n=1 Tax=Sphingorhabdus sp. TaxID=1902408 RepID=UPI0032B838B7